MCSTILTLAGTASRACLHCIQHSQQLAPRQEETFPFITGRATSVPIGLLESVQLQTVVQIQAARDLMSGNGIWYMCQILPMLLPQLACHPRSIQSPPSSCPRMPPSCLLPTHSRMPPIIAATELSQRKLTKPGLVLAQGG